MLGGRKDLPWAPDGRTALEMTCLRMLAFSPRRDALHPASPHCVAPVNDEQCGEQRHAGWHLCRERPAAESAALAPISGASPRLMPPSLRWWMTLPTLPTARRRRKPPNCSVSRMSCCAKRAHGVSTMSPLCQMRSPMCLRTQPHSPLMLASMPQPIRTIPVASR
ncbi:hypothetical protein RI537_04655 [Aeromonas salmonicida]|uniref:hypothetical protein n=1 Tax=Aeromonas salmonicida TaxID=645 RepID=UPI0034228511